MQILGIIYTCLNSTFWAIGRTYDFIKIVLIKKVKTNIYIFEMFFKELEYRIFWFDKSRQLALYNLNSVSFAEKT